MGASGCCGVAPADLAAKDDGHELTVTTFDWS